MLRLAPIGDIHLTEGPRFADTAKCLDWVLSDAVRGGTLPDLWAIGGDLTGTGIRHESTILERNQLDLFFQSACDQAPGVLIAGNHDVLRDLEGYGRLKAAHRLHVVTSPTLLEIPDRQGRMTWVACIPYPDKGVLADITRGSIADTNATASEALRALLRHWRAHINETRPDQPVVLMAHLTIVGSKLAGGEIMATKEVCLDVADLIEFNADFNALSHIHLFQTFGPRAAYASSPTAQQHGETDRKGYLLVDVYRDRDPVIEHRPTPARRLATVQAVWRPAEDGAYGWEVTGEVPEGAEVRVQARIPEEQLVTCPTDQLEGLVKAAGAHAVLLDRAVVPAVRVRSEAMAHATTTADRLRAYWESIGNLAPSPEQAERCLVLLEGVEAAVPPRDKFSAGVTGDALDLRRMRIKGAGRTIPNEISIDFEALGEGVIALVGDNGAGKTRLLECSGPATWFGRYLYYDCRLVDHVPDGVNDALFEVEWANGQDTYRARVKADPSASKRGKQEGFLDGLNRLTGEWEPIASSGKWEPDYEEAIASVVPPLDLLRISVVSAQGGKRDLMALDRADRREFMIRELRLDHLQDQADLCSQNAGVVAAKLEPLRKTIAGLQAKVDELPRLLAESAAANAERLTREAALAGLRTAAATAELTSQGAAGELARAEGRESASKARRDALAAEVAQLRTAAAAADDRVAAALAIISGGEGPAVADPAAELAALEQRQGQLEEGRSTLVVLYQQSNEAAQSCFEAAATARAAEKTAAAELAAAKAIEAKLSGLPAAERERDELTAELAAAEAALGTAETEVVSLRAAAEAARERAARVTNLTDRIAQLQQQATALRGVDLTRDICGVCPLTESARGAQATLETVTAELAGLGTDAAAEAVALAAKRTAATERAAAETTKVRALQPRVATAGAAVAALHGMKAAAPDVAKLAAAVADARNAVVAAESREAAAGEVRADTKAQGQEIARWLSAATEYRDQLRTLRDKIASQQAAAGDLKAARDELAAAKARIETIAPELAALAPIDLSALRAAATEAQAAHQRTAEAVRVAEAAVLVAEAAVTSSAAAVAAGEVARGQLAEQRQLEAAAVRSTEDWEVLAKGLGVRGAQALCLDQAGPAISRIGNELLQAAFNSRFSFDFVTQVPKADGKGFKEDYTIRLLDARLGEIKRGSGGEMVLVNEAIRLAIAIHHATAGGARMRTLWRDETAEALDAKFQDGYVQMLQRARELGSFRRVLLIAHSERIWQQADAQVFLAPAVGRRRAAVFTDQAEWEAYTASDSGPPEIEPVSGLPFATLGEVVPRRDIIDGVPQTFTTGDLFGAPVMPAGREGSE